MTLDQYGRILRYVEDYLSDAWKGLSDEEIKSRMHEFISIKDILRKYVNKEEDQMLSEKYNKIFADGMAKWQKWSEDNNV
jgi:hypothetical protein